MYNGVCPQIEGVLAAVDVTQDKELGEQFKIQGFPTGNSSLLQAITGS